MGLTTFSIPIFLCLAQKTLNFVPLGPNDAKDAQPSSRQAIYHFIEKKNIYAMSFEKISNIIRNEERRNIQ
jgi:hypothetical protein